MTWLRRENGMKTLDVWLPVAFGVFLFPLQVLAQQCNAHFTFDGDLQDSGANGYHGHMIGKDGAKATPRFIDGKSGQALQLDGTSAMRSFIDLHSETCPQVTVTAWIQIMRTGAKGTQYIFSTAAVAGQDFDSPVLTSH